MRRTEKFMDGCEAVPKKVLEVEAETVVRGSRFQTGGIATIEIATF